MRTFFAAIFLVIGTSGAALAAEQVASIEVTGLTCPSCPYIAAQAVKSIESVEIVNSDYDEASQKIVFNVKFDDELTTAEAIASAPFEYGYPGSVLSVGVGG